MKFSFIVPTCAGNEAKINNLIESINRERIPPEDYEIIIVGDYQPPSLKFKIRDIACVDIRMESGATLKIISFDEKLIDKHITKKKNVGLDNATGDACFFMHDYVNLTSGWYKGMLEFGDDWDCLVFPLSYEDGSRAIDWQLAPYSSIPDNRLKQFIDKKLGYQLADDIIKFKDYDFPHGELSRWMYAPGNAFCVKTDKMREFRQNESLMWDCGEDLEWSRRFTTKYTLKLNKGSPCQFNGGGRPAGHRFCPPMVIEIIKEFVKGN